MLFESADAAASVNAIANLALIAFGLLAAGATFIAYLSGSAMKRHSDIEIQRAQTDAERARAEAGRANEHAAELAQETELLRANAAWRRLTEPQAHALVTALKGTDAPVFVVDVLGDPESTTFADEFTAALQAEGFTVQQQDRGYAGPPPIGIFVSRTPDGRGDRVANALASAGLDITGRHQPEQNNQLVILIGVKPRLF